MATEYSVPAGATLALATRSTVDSLDSTVPTIETPAYQRSLARWERCRDVYQGTEAIRAATTDYLPQYAGETEALYEARSTISALFNGYARTVAAAVGMLTEPEPVLGDDMPEQLVAMWENVNGDGMHGAVFTRRLAAAGMVDGYAGILTEYPRPDDPSIDRSRASSEAALRLETGGDLNAGDQAALGLRPYFILVRADEVLPIYETVNGRRTLVMLIWRHGVTVRRGRFGLETVARYNVYELVNGAVWYERWTEASQGGTPVLDEGPTLMRGLSGIPWSPFAAGDELGEHEYKPTLLDLADMNLTHHRIATGRLSLIEQACVVTPVRVGCPPDEEGNYPQLILGPSNTIEVPATAGVSTPVYYLAPPVEALNPAREALQDCKAEMGAMGAAFLAPQLVQETAAAKRMDKSAEAASIGSVARALKDCLESAFAFAAQYIKQPAGSITTNSEFAGEGVSEGYLAVCVKAFQEGALTLEELRHVIQTGELPEGFDSADEAILTELAAQTAAKAAQKELELAAQQQSQPSGDEDAEEVAA